MVPITSTRGKCSSTTMRSNNKRIIVVLVCEQETCCWLIAKLSRGWMITLGGPAIRLGEWSSLESRFTFKRLFFHGYFTVTYCFGMRWKVDPLFVRNQQVFLSLELRDSESKLIPFTPKMKLTKQGSKIDTKNKFYSIEAIKRQNLTCYIHGHQVAPNDLYYLFDYATLSSPRETYCKSFDKIPAVIREWLMSEGLKVRGYSDWLINDAHGTL